MKKVLLNVAAVAMIVSLAACGSEGPSEAEKQRIQDSIEAAEAAAAEEEALRMAEEQAAAAEAAAADSTAATDSTAVEEEVAE